MTDIYEKPIKCLNKGEVLLYPTDTVWGLGCDVFNKKAVNRIFDIKNRDRSKPLLILVSDIDMLKKYVPHIHPRIETLLSFHMRPLTVIYDNPIGLPDWILAPNQSIAIRIVKDSYIKSLMKIYKKPIVSTSANIQGDPTPDDFESISKNIIENVDYVIPSHYSNKVIHPPSVIIRYDREGQIDLVR